MSQFLIIYEKSTGTIIDQIEYADADHSTALARRAELERQHGVGGDIEVAKLVVTRTKRSRAAPRQSRIPGGHLR